MGNEEETNRPPLPEGWVWASVRGNAIWEDPSDEEMMSVGLEEEGFEAIRWGSYDSYKRAWECSPASVPPKVVIACLVDAGELPGSVLSPSNQEDSHFPDEYQKWLSAPERWADKKILIERTTFEGGYAWCTPGGTEGGHDVVYHIDECHLYQNSAPTGLQADPEHLRAAVRALLLASGASIYVESEDGTLTRLQDEKKT